MKTLLTTFCVTIAVLLGSAGNSWSADFQKGVTAAQSGDFATALREWTPLAEQVLPLQDVLRRVALLSPNRARPLLPKPYIYI